MDRRMIMTRKAFILALLSLYEIATTVVAANAATAPCPPPASSSNPPPLLPKIDTHAHIIPPFYRELLLSDYGNLSAGRNAPPPWNVSEHLALNALYNIVTSVVSVIIPGARLYKDEPVENGRNLARQLNLYAKDLTVQYPKNFLFFAVLTLPDVEGAVDEAVYALDTLGAAGVVVLANAFGELLGTRRYDPLYQVLNDRKAVVFIHPAITPCPDSPSALPSFVVDFLLDTVRAAVELVLNNVTTDFPDITFILSHSGGFLPFAATRAATFSAQLAGIPPEVGIPVFLELLSQFTVDDAQSATRTALPSTLAFFNESRILFGTDFPYTAAPSIEASTLQNPPIRLSKKLQKKITFGNSYDLFGRFLV